ncbi:hypothetical protein ACEPPN_012403 [Leptodophora sp. 'Broadleaf-Isolate-01']
MSDNITTDEMALALFCLELADHNQDISVQTLPWIHKEFTLFKDLPAELRRMIFRGMFPGVQRVVLYEHHNVAAGIHSSHLQLPFPPITSNINRESRHETLKYYQHFDAPWYPRQRRGLWNPRKDILQLETVVFVENQVAGFFLDSWKSFVESVKFLELVTSRHEQDDFLLAALDPMKTWNPLRELKNLSELVLRGKPNNEAIKMEEWRSAIEGFYKTLKAKGSKGRICRKASKKVSVPEVKAFGS